MGHAAQQLSFFTSFRNVSALIPMGTSNGQVIDEYNLRNGVSPETAPRLRCRREAKRGPRLLVLVIEKKKSGESVHYLYAPKESTVRPYRKTPTRIVPTRWNPDKLKR
jgi:hypothetical protein